MLPYGAAFVSIRYFLCFLCKHMTHIALVLLLVQGEESLFCMLCLILCVLVSTPVRISGSRVGFVVYLVQNCENWDSYKDVGECLNLLECSHRRFGGAEEDGARIFSEMLVSTPICTATCPRRPEYPWELFDSIIFAWRVKWANICRLQFVISNTFCFWMLLVLQVRVKAVGQHSDHPLCLRNKLPHVQFKLEFVFMWNSDRCLFSVSVPIVLSSGCVSPVSLLRLAVPLS